MFYLFRFEAEAYPDLSRVPLHMRMKLDMTGLKLSLKDWLSLSPEERIVLCHLPVETEGESKAFSAYIHFLCRKYRGAPASVSSPVSAALWNRCDRIPAEVLAKNAEDGRGVTLQEWSGWRSHERYALYKTALSKSEPANFHAVLKELRGATTE